MRFRVGMGEGKSFLRMVQLLGRGLERDLASLKGRRR